jgi:hypothetical protein
MKLIKTPVKSQQSWKTYKEKLEQRREQTNKEKKDLHLDSCNGFSKIGKHGYLDLL